jgi:mannose-1-phosphate guanylyltransferase
MTIDLGNALKINKMNYNISSNSDSFIIEDGILTFSKSPNRPQNNYGLIYIKPKSDELPAYRLQIFSHKIPEKLKNTYFDTNGNILNMKTYTDEYLRPILKSNSPKLLFLANYSANARIQSVEDCGPGGNCQIPPPVRYTE